MNQKRVDEFSAIQRVPAMYESDVVIHQGGLMSYGPKGEDLFRQAASFIDLQMPRRSCFSSLVADPSSPQPRP